MLPNWFGEGWEGEGGGEGKGEGRERWRGRWRERRRGDRKGEGREMGRREGGREKGGVGKRSWMREGKIEMWERLEWGETKRLSCVHRLTVCTA